MLQRNIQTIKGTQVLEVCGPNGIVTFSSFGSLGAYIFAHSPKPTKLTDHQDQCLFLEMPGYCDGSVVSASVLQYQENELWLYMERYYHQYLEIEA